jgi:hypothetical protein
MRDPTHRGTNWRAEQAHTLVATPAAILPRHTLLPQAEKFFQLAR